MSAFRHAGWLASALSLLAACAGSEPAAGDSAGPSGAATVALQAPPSVSGRLLREGEQLRFVPCGETGPGLVVDDEDETPWSGRQRRWMA